MQGAARAVEYLPPVTSPDPETPQPRSSLEPAGLVLLALLSVVWGWWAWQDGAYFGVVLLPGAIVLCLGGGLLAGFAPWRADWRLSRPAALALVGLTALAIWSLLSALWSPAPDVAVEDGQRIAIYALAFGLGVWLCNLLGPRIQLSLVPLAAAGGFAGVATIVALTTGDDPLSALEIDGTLDYPLGYRNATAAFFMITLFPALGLAADRDLDWRARGAALATATLSIGFFALCQSRASLPALLLALLVYLLLSPSRLRALSWLVLAALPAIGVVPATVDLYAAADEGIRSATPEMHAAGIAAAVTATVSLALGALAARFESRHSRPPFDRDGSQPCDRPGDGGCGGGRRGRLRRRGRQPGRLDRRPGGGVSRRG